MTSAGNEIPTTSGGSSDDWLTKELGNFCKEAQVWQEVDTRVMALFMSRAKKWPVRPSVVDYRTGGLV